MEAYPLEADELPATDDSFDNEAFEALEDEDVAMAVLNAHQASADSVNVENVIVLTARLAQVLAEEADLLANMRLSSLEELQREKLLLAGAMEKQKKLFDRFPEKLHDIGYEERDRLEQIIEIFESIMRENYRRLLIAKEVNRKVVEAIAEAVSEASAQSLYNKKGMSDAGSAESLSVSVDKRI
jgi:tRNA/tmRNA/rRNA uracil-C5-methylase (TrmA/RlmC/RlmD family)